MIARSWELTLVPPKPLPISTKTLISGRTARFLPLITHLYAVLEAHKTRLAASIGADATLDNLDQPLHFLSSEADPPLLHWHV